MTHDGVRSQEFEGEVGTLLRTQRVGRRMRSYRNVTSTNTVASEWARDGAPHGAVVFAEYQRQGRGRLGRTWQAHPGLNLTFSVVLRPNLQPELWGLVTITASVAVAEAVSAFSTPTEPSIKWPNDVLLNELKCCGMLLESNWPPKRQDVEPHVVLGIGLNVNQMDFPEELRASATSILLETGRTVRRAELFAAVLNRLEDCMNDAHSDPEAVKRQYMARMSDLNEDVELRFANEAGSIRGVAIGLDESGGLILQTDAGPRAFHAGEVTRSR